MSKTKEQVVGYYLESNYAAMSDMAGALAQAIEIYESVLADSSFQRDEIESIGNAVMRGEVDGKPYQMNKVRAGSPWD